MRKELAKDFRNTKVYIFVMILVLGLNSCSDSEEGNLPAPVITSVDFDVVEGKYTGASTIGMNVRSESMILTKVDDNSFTVELFEGRQDFKPSFNSDGVTPELMGTLEIETDGTTAVLDLVLDSDSPRCSGTYKGTGSRNNTKGTFVFNIFFDENCFDLGSFKGQFSYDFKKIEN